MNKNLIAVTIGDIEGIGIEILIKLWKNNKINNFVLFSNNRIFERYLNRKNTERSNKCLWFKVTFPT